MFEIKKLTTLRDLNPETLKFVLDPRFISISDINTMIVSNMFHFVCQNSTGRSPTNLIANSVVKIHDRTWRFKAVKSIAILKH